MSSWRLEHSSKIFSKVRCHFYKEHAIMMNKERLRMRPMWTLRSAPVGMLQYRSKIRTWGVIRTTDHRLVIDILGSLIMVNSTWFHVFYKNAMRFKCLSSCEISANDCSQYSDFNSTWLVIFDVFNITFFKAEKRFIPTLLAARKIFHWYVGLSFSK